MPRNPGFATDTAMAAVGTRKGKKAIKKPGAKPKVATSIQPKGFGGPGRKPC